MTIRNDNLFLIEKSTTATIRILLQDVNLNMVTGIAHGDVTTAKLINYDNSSSDLTVDASTWTEIGNGFYTLEISSAVLANTGEISVLIEATGCVPSVRHLLVIEQTASDLISTTDSVVDSISSSLSTVGLNVGSIKLTVEDTNSDLETTSSAISGLQSSISLLNNLSSADIETAISSARLATKSLANKILESALYSERLLLGLLNGNYEIDSTNNQMIVTLNTEKLEQGGDSFNMTSFDLTDENGDPTNEYPYKRDINVLSSLGFKYTSKIWSAKPATGSYHTFNISIDWGGELTEQSWGEDTILVRAYYCLSDDDVIALFDERLPSGVVPSSATEIGGNPIVIYVPVSEIYDSVVFLVTKLDHETRIQTLLTAFDFDYFSTDTEKHAIIAGEETDVTINTWGVN